MGRSYDSIPHLPGSQGSVDRYIEKGLHDLLTRGPFPNGASLTVQEKLDGSNISVEMVDGELRGQLRSGNLVAASGYRQHRLFDYWLTIKNQDRFRSVLEDCDRICGEWLAQAHGTRYDLTNHEPWVVFDMWRGGRRLPVREMADALDGRFITPKVMHTGGPLSLEDLDPMLRRSGHGATDRVECAVYRYEEEGQLSAIAKYVDPEKVIGGYLPGQELNPSGQEVWNIDITRFYGGDSAQRGA